MSLGVHAAGLSILGGLEGGPQDDARAAVYQEVGTAATTNGRDHLGREYHLVFVGGDWRGRIDGGSWRIGVRLLLSLSLHLLETRFKARPELIGKDRIGLYGLSHDTNLAYVTQTVGQVLVKAIRHRHEINGLYLRKFSVRLGKAPRRGKR